MIRQLARLTRRVPAAGPHAVALGVYANDEDTGLPARDRGFEGVACVDDAARAVVLLLDLYRDTGDRRLGEWATGLVDFVLYMQREDGRFHNFIRDWDGTINTDGPTSYAGGTFWQARAVRALAKAHLVLRDSRVAGPLARQSAHALLAPQIEAAFPERTIQPYGVAAAVYAMDRLYQATGDSAYSRWREQARAWFDGRNSALLPVYDRVNGRVSDGIDDGRLNPHSGAESNIVGAQALLPDIASLVRTLLV